MPPRDQPPRDRRRGAGKDVDPPPTGRSHSKISDARAYTPRGRSVREADERDASARSRDGAARRDGAGGRDRVDGRDRAAGRDGQDGGVRRDGRDGVGGRDRAGREDAGGAGSRRTRGSGRPAEKARPSLQVLDGGIPVANRPTGGRGARSERTAPSGARLDRQTTDSQRVGRQPADARRGGRPPVDDRRSGRQPVDGERGTRERATRTTPRSTTPRSTAPRSTATRSTATRAEPAPRRRQATRAAKTRDPRRAPQRSRKPRRPPRLGDPGRRLRVASLLALALFLAIGVRLVTLQVVDTPAYADGGLGERLKTVTMPAPRGAIYDRSGAVLAHSVDARYIAVDPEYVKDPIKTAEQLSPLLAMPRSTLLEKLQKKIRPGGGVSRFEWLARGVDTVTAAKVSALKLPEIIIDRDERREVPGRDLAANLIGFTGEDLNGLEGIEARYDPLLRGVNGERKFEVGRGTELAKEIPGGYRRETAAQPGTSLALTIDRDLQFEIQRMLTERMRAVKASLGAAVVLDVKTGEVLSQASYPTYDAGAWLSAKPTDRQDVASSVVVDPGSVHKALIFGAALEEGIITPNSVLAIGPKIRKGGMNFTDTHPRPEGTKVTMPGLLAYSSNVGTIKLADLLGRERVYQYQLKFGLGQATGEGVSGEAEGKVLKPADWSGSAYGSVPIGHSVDATTLQMAAAYAAIANNGVYVQPHLIKETIAADGTRAPAQAVESHRVLSAKTATQLRTLMESVITMPGATGAAAKISGYRVAGKTGTSKRLSGGDYLPGEVASFIGMAPAENPRYVVAIFAHTPSGGGGRIAGPSFKDMMSFTLRHYRVPPSTTAAPKFRALP